jgi:hypothetical protein
MHSPTMTNDKLRMVLRFAIALGVTLCVIVNCVSEPKETSRGGETHFLMPCNPNDSCGGTLACVCGICTRTCSDSSGCQSLAASATCIANADRAAADSCSGTPTAKVCDVPCTADESCQTLSMSLRCSYGFCRNDSGTVKNDAGSADACAQSQVAANEVIFLGDSFVATSHQIPTDVEGFARQAGTLAAGEHYRDISSLTGNSLALESPYLADKYTSAQAESPVRVVIMNGGGADIFLGACDTPPTESCPALANAAAAVPPLLAQMAQDGVQHVVYFFYPNPVDATLQAKMDVLRPLIQGACENSPVPCHWLDLRPTFAGHYSDYILADGKNPTDTGSAAAAAAIWNTMQQNCVAQ